MSRIDQLSADLAHKAHVAAMSRDYVCEPNIGAGQFLHHRHFLTPPLTTRRRCSSLYVYMLQYDACSDVEQSTAPWPVSAVLWSLWSLSRWGKQVLPAAQHAFSLHSASASDRACCLWPHQTHWQLQEVTGLCVACSHFLLLCTSHCGASLGLFTSQKPKYAEIVDIRLGDGTYRRGQVLEVDGTRAVVQVLTRLLLDSHRQSLGCLFFLTSAIK